MASNGHARLSPSNHRWPHCPGSIREEAAYPDSSGPAALDGTGSHLLLEIALRTERPDVRADEWLHRVIGEGHDEMPQGWYVEADRCERVQMCLDYIARRRQELEIVSIEAESSSSPGHYLVGRNDWWGTVDITIRGICRTTGQKVIEVIDYKDGRGFVDCKNNPQLIGYGCGKLGPFIYNNQSRKCNPHNDPHLVRMTIVQPKTNPVVRYHDADSTEVWEAGHALARAAAATDDPLAPLIAGKHCEWCKHGRAGNCETKNRTALDGAEKGLTVMTTAIDGKTSMIEAIRSGQIAPATMSEEQIAAILDASTTIKKLIETVEEEALTRLASGVNIPGYEIGKGRSSSQWKDEDEVVAAKLKGMRYLKDEIYPPKLVSPAQALKKSTLSDRQKKALEEMIEKVAGKDKVVKTKVEVIANADVATMFADVKKPEALSFL